MRANGPGPSAQRRGRSSPAPRPAKRAQPKRKPAAKRRPASGASQNQSQANVSTSKKSLAQVLSPKNIQQSLKTVGQLHGVVRNWLGYLQQADQLLETISVTSSSLRESGVLEKLLKQKGKNLSTDDFTNILIALMNSPIGNQMFKALGSQSDDSDGAATTADK